MFYVTNCLFHHIIIFNTSFIAKYKSTILWVPSTQLILSLCTLFLTHAFTTLFCLVVTMRRNLSSLVSTINFLTYNMPSHARPHNKQKRHPIPNRIASMRYPNQDHITWIVHSFSAHNKNIASYPRSHDKDKYHII